MLLHSTDTSNFNAFDEFFENELYQLHDEHASNDSLKQIEEYLINASEQSVGPRLSTQNNSKTPQPWRQDLWSLDGEAGVKPGNNWEAQLEPDSSSTTNLVSNIHPAFDDSGKDHDGGRQKVNVFKYPEFFSQSPTCYSPFDREKTHSSTAKNAQLLRKQHEDRQDLWQQESHLQNPHQDEFEVVPRRNRLLQLGNRMSDLAYPLVPSYVSQRLQRYCHPLQYSPKQRSEDVNHRLGDNSHISHPFNEPDFILAWDIENLTSSDDSQNSAQSHTSQNRYQNDVRSYTNASLQQPYPTDQNLEEFCDESLAPVPQREAHILIDRHPELLQHGLRIRYPTPNEIGRAISYDSSQLQDSPVKITAQAQRQNPFTGYIELPFRPGYAQSIPSGAKQQKHKSLSCSPSSTLSAFNPSPNRDLPQQSPSRSTRARRKSIHKSGPVKETMKTSESAAASPTRNHSRTRSKSRSRSTHTRTRSTSTKLTKAAKHSSAPVPAPSEFDFDFVNYTAQDSEKLMSDVAPSGSSRTRARREQEARDKRNRLNEAAIIAVREAGGDVRSLQWRLAS